MKMEHQLMNPLATDGFEFVEYTAPDAESVEKLKQLFLSLGFVEVARHRSKNVSLFRQGDINFILNAERSQPAAEFASAHGPSACAMAWRSSRSMRACTSSAIAYRVNSASMRPSSVRAASLGFSSA